MHRCSNHLFLTYLVMKKLKPKPKSLLRSLLMKPRAKMKEGISSGKKRQKPTVKCLVKA